MNTKLSWGVLSTANIGTTVVIPAMQKSTRLSVDAIASRDGVRAREAAERLGIAKSYDSYDALLADSEIDAIYNPLPNHLHVHWTLEALRAGKHVLCEKPIALDTAEAEQLLAAREESGKLVAEAFMVRQHPQWLRARELVREGHLGTVRAIHALFSYYLTDPGNVRNRADIGGGALYDVGCYAVAASRFLFEAEPIRALALIDRDPELKTDRLTSAIIEFPGGRRLLFTCATQLVPCQKVEVLGTERLLEIEVPFNQNPEVPARLRLDDGGRIKGEADMVEELASADQYTLQAEALCEAIVSGAPLPFPIEDAIANMRVIDALFRSAEIGGWEDI